MRKPTNNITGNHRMRNAVAKYALTNGHTLSIFQDECAESPREWDNLGTMTCFHKRYNLGDNMKNDSMLSDSSNFDSWDALEEFLINERGAEVILPIYMYDHSGITINTTGFNDPWDSGQVGFIWVSKERILSEFHDVSPNTIEIVTNCLIGEVDTYNKYLTGDVYGYEIEDEGVIVESCFGFYGRDIKTNGMLDNMDSNDIPSDGILKEIEN